ncbi:MAG: fibronectin type III domain-containing protein [Bacteroidales bacterium]|nr:fibronectin type III domain-containing protein [Bacteroidales bacterium]
MKNYTKALTALLFMAALVFAVGCKKDNNNNNDNPSESKPSVTTSAVINITDKGADCGGVVTSEGTSAVVERGVCWSEDSYPTVSDYHLAVEGGLGSFTCHLTGLKANTTYYVRAYAINGVGIAYGSQVNFVTLQDAMLPLVLIDEVTEITAYSAMVSGSVEEEGGDVVRETGFCWSEWDDPTLDDDHLTLGASDFFEGYISELEPNTTYYVCAYATNSYGVGYSPVIEFTTLPLAPSPSMPTISVIEEEGYLKDGDVVELNIEYQFGFVMASEAGLSSLVIKIDDEMVDEVALSSMEYTYRDGVIFTFDLDKEIIDEHTFSAMVTDVNGQTARTSFTVSVNKEPQPLIVSGFEWVREGANPGTGLEQFGLKWDANISRGIYARIRPLDGVTLYQFDPSVWNETVTEADKAALFANALETLLPIDRYTNVNLVPVAMDYDDVLGTILPDGSMCLIHIMHSETEYTKVFRATISGEYK